MKVVSTLHDLTQKVGANSKSFPTLPAFKQASGSRLYAQSGNVFLDLAFTTYSNLLGHNISSIQQAIITAANHLPPLDNSIEHTEIQSVYNSVNLLLPEHIKTSLICNHESQAIDAAIKMAFLYWEAQDMPDKTKLIGFAHAHHGYSLGVSSLNASNRVYQPLAPLATDCELIPYPSTWLNDNHIEHKESLAYQRLEQYLEEHHHDCCAMVVEPLIQSHNGMQICRPSFLEKVAKLIKTYDILIIADERFTGLYRTGKFLASDLLELSPDLCVLGNTLTNNTLPCGIVATGENIRNTLDRKLVNPNFIKSHGQQTTAYTLAAIQATLAIVTAANTQKHLQNIQDIHKTKVHWLSRKPIVRNTRFLGTIAAFDIICERHNQQKALQLWFQQACMDNQLLLAMHNSSIFIIPPFCMSAEDLQEVYIKVDKILAALPLHYITPPVN
mgnify:CR=1 FL=1